MAKKQYLGAKITILAVAAGAVMYGTAWLSANEPPASDTPNTNTNSTYSGTGTGTTAPATSTGSNLTTQGSTTNRPVQSAAPRAKKSRAS